MMSVEQDLSKQLVLNTTNDFKAKTLTILVLNLMPNKLETEGQFVDLLNDQNHNLALTFLYPETHHFKSADTLPYLQESYATFSQIKAGYYDGLIITGAPVETLDFSLVDYWREFGELVDWSKTHVSQTLFICWAAQAGLFHDYGIKKYPVRPKIFGIFGHEVRQQAPLVEGLPETFYLPHSRNTTLKSADILAHPDLRLLVDDSDVGPVVVQSRDGRQTFITGHPEYSTQTLANEYRRDLKAGIPITLPENYFYANDPTQKIINRWQPASQQLIKNWFKSFK
ncbi:homoserine O-succinyltransferase [Loigolactobacillus iwatensis]|uniref:homoserine O-succinyltransferase n=1 Tax=Loigolactobacillus iwatensis TaxID=1267156 RepID=UPI001CDC7CA3|nr:homoserine O-succinyltransferase [Loigolactobacillus iwatensis]